MDLLMFGSRSLLVDVWETVGDRYHFFYSFISISVVIINSIVFHTYFVSGCLRERVSRSLFRPNGIRHRYPCRGGITVLYADILALREERFLISFYITSRHLQSKQVVVYSILMHRLGFIDFLPLR